LLAIICLGWFTLRRRQLNKIFAAGVLLLIVALPLRMIISESAIWLRFVGWIAP
jgi:hypothetical protein